MNKTDYSFKDAAKKIGYRPSSGEPYRQLYLLCKKMGIIDSKREPLSPYKYDGLFEVRQVTFPNKHVGNQTFVTNKGLIFLRGLIIGVRVMAERIRSTNHADENTTRTPESTGQSARAST